MCVSFRWGFQSQEMVTVLDTGGVRLEYSLAEVEKASPPGAPVTPKTSVTVVDLEYIAHPSNQSVSYNAMLLVHRVHQCKR